MKLTDFGIVFVLIFICFTTITDTKISMTAQVSKEQMAYNNAIDTAVNDALYMLVESDDGRKISMDQDKAMDTFFSSLCINLGKPLTKAACEQLKEFIPVIIFVTDDGLIVYHHEAKADGTMEFVKDDLKEFKCSIGKINYRFHLNDDIDIVCQNQYYTGKVDDLKVIINDPLIKNSELYENTKSKTIISLIIDNLKMYTSDKYFKTDKSSWDYYIPIETDGMWNRTVKDISMLVMFSGYPYSDTSLGYYSKFAFGGARLWKRE